MGAKWVRSKQWDDRVFPAWAWPLKAVLRVFSSIPLAIVLLTLVAAYGVLASVPIGILALIPTKAFYAMTLLGVAAVVAALPLWVMRRAWKPTTGGARAGRFAATFLGGVVLLFVAWELWVLLLWPKLQYDPATREGVRFFAEFCERYSATTMRRLPGVEMSELEFYAWWPLRLVLMLFVVNMIVATVRRIEFTFPNVGVLTVHSGIVVIALGSAYYSGLKKEGDTLLLAGPLGAEGVPEVGPPQQFFYDNTRTVLWARQEVPMRMWEQRPIQPPRYNEYSLGAAGDVTALSTIGRGNQPGIDQGRTLSEPIEPFPDHAGPLRRLARSAGLVKDTRSSSSTLIDEDISFRLVGYASYAELVPDWIKGEPAPGEKPNPMRFARLESERDDKGQKTGRPLSFSFFFMPERPKDRLGETEVFGIEYTRGMNEQRWADLQSVLPPTADGRAAAHGLVVEVPREGREPYRGVYSFSQPGATIVVGDTGYTLTVKELHQTPPFPIVTEGYRESQSSLAVVRVVPPPPADGKAVAFDRWVYHRFPEITQDLMEELNERGMPRRRGADPGIRIGYVDASKLQLYVDEREDGTCRALVRVPGQAARVIERVPEGGRIDEIMPGLHLQLAERWAHAIQGEAPIVVPTERREKDQVGVHGKAAIAVEVSVRGSEKSPAFTRRLWIPFSKYLGIDPKLTRKVDLPDGRKLELAFGRQVHDLPGFMIRLKKFDMISYEHTDQPRDYQSLIEVIPTHDAGSKPKFERFEHITKLNAPLQAPFMWDDEKRSWMGNMGGTLLSRLNPAQYKFSQAGWDPQTWERTSEQAARGEIPRAYASFTILGVGNNPGIHVIALGGVMMSVGIPWAFYIKPLILRRRKQALQAMVAARGADGAGRSGTAIPASEGVR